ncbi:hypothetical protein PENCOP_c009G03880 [Penicillium coprophilum]|uniref:Uncharacterized protein n=1 Tax=Penicillium coprophilum TaxID=36646 RepID=A0A1V6UH39_9EURO|nr:hypothetical protein PENCOP_c009G03880 [Penicillium coprophilum]
MAAPEDGFTADLFVPLAPHPHQLLNSLQSIVSSSEQGYTTSSSGTNSQGNHYYSRDYGSSASNSNSYHYSNTTVSYFYSNPNGSSYYNSGSGSSTYTPSSGGSGGSGKKQVFMS